ncbi:MAG: hypothetical protein GKR94_11775 [Gammaproteobacteria bacterium]|nr:hypothetical protein [Gammaproteobacteria bacterium]
MAIGIAIGANWKKISAQLGIYAPALKDVGEKAGDVYTAAQAAIVGKLEEFADAHEATVASMRDTENSTGDTGAAAASGDDPEVDDPQADNAQADNAQGEDSKAVDDIGADAGAKVPPAAKAVTEDWGTGTAAAHASPSADSHLQHHDSLPG